MRKGVKNNMSIYKMYIFMFLFIVILFFILTPGVLLSLPPKGSKMMVAAVHAIVFALLFTLTNKFVWNWGVSSGLIVKDGFVEGNKHKGKKVKK